MKIAFPHNTFPGGFLKSIQQSCEKLGHETFMCLPYNANLINKFGRRIPGKKAFDHFNNIKENDYNQDIIKQISKFKPDVFFNISGSNLFPEIIKRIKEEIGAFTICYIADNPCDPDPRRDKYFAMSLRYYEVLLYADEIWLKIIRNLAPQSKTIKFLGGYDTEIFYPVNKKRISIEDINNLGCDIAFTGGSYRESAEGAYRAGILSSLDDFDLKIWGDKGWKYRFRFYPSLRKAFQDNRLSYERLMKLYQICKIYINLPSPQIFTSFQPRVFEIAAAKGFQIIDHSDELTNLFGDCVATFKNISELKEKINYYLNNEKERNIITENLYQKVKINYSWEKQLSNIFDEIGLK